MAKYITPEEFINETEGHAYDMDGAYGVQCVDGIKKFAYDVYGECNFTCGNGWAYGLWTNYGSNGVERYFNQHSYIEAREGDWIIWNWGSKGSPNSHVGMFVENVNDELVKTYGQNQDGKKYFNFCNCYRDGILGVLRPKIYDEQPAPQYINIPPSIEERNVYDKNTKKLIATIKPKKFGGLTYRIYNLVDNGYYAEIETLDYGRCLVRITDMTPITNKPLYEHGNY